MVGRTARWPALTAVAVTDVSSARMEVEMSWSEWLALAMLEGGGQGGAVEDTGERGYGWRLGFGCKETGSGVGGEEDFSILSVSFCLL